MRVAEIPRLSRRLPPAMVWALVLALLPPLACAGATENGGSTAAVVQGDLVSMLPASATTIGYIDFAGLRDSAAYAFAREQGADLGNLGDMEEMIRRTGIDPRTDLHAAAFAVGSLRDMREGDGVAVIVVADFDRARVEESLAKLPTREIAGRQVHVLASWSTEDDDGEDHGTEHDADENEGEHDADEDEAEHTEGEPDEEDTGVIGILDDQTLVLGTDAMVAAVLEVQAGTGSARTNERLMALVEDVDTDSEVWAVSLQDQIFDGMAPAQGMPQIPVDRIKEMIVSMRFAEGVALRFRGRTERTEDAKLLGDSLNGMLAFGKMMLQSSTPAIFEIIDRGVQAGSTGRDVTIRAQLTISDLETLRDFARSTMEGEGGGEIGA